jgi:hypothetical protein
MTDATSGATTVTWREIRLAFALVVGIAGGLWGMVILFSDYPVDWSAARWMVYVLVSHAVFGAVVGALVPKWWYLSLVTGWPVLLLGVLNLIVGSSEFLVELLLPIVATLLVAGLLGAGAARLLEVVVVRLRSAAR